MNTYVLEGISFQWDDKKNATNIAKHGISFETAAFIFLDENRVEYCDNRFNEERFITIGMVRNILYVVYTLHGDSIRMISARLATKSERGMYYDSNNDT